jgi:hypothetical protein
MFWRASLEKRVLRRTFWTWKRERSSSDRIEQTTYLDASQFVFITRFHYGDQNKETEKDEILARVEEMKNTSVIAARKPWLKRRKPDSDIKTDLHRLWGFGLDSVTSSCGFLWAQNWTFGFHTGREVVLNTRASINPQVRTRPRGVNFGYLPRSNISRS